MEFEKQLQDLMTLQDPGAAFAENVCALARARVKGRSSTRSRFVVIGTFLVAAAAAAMLGVWLRPADQPGVTMTSVSVTPPAAERKVIESSVEIPETSTTAPVPVEETMRESAPSLPPPPQFTVRVAPLKNEAKDVLARNAIDAFHAAFLKELRTVPGLTLIEDEPDGNKPEAPMPYQITVRGWGLPPENHYAVEVGVEKLASDGPGRSGSSSGMVGEILPACAGLPPTDPPSCLDPSGLAAIEVHKLRTMMFPADPSLQLRLQARLSSRNLDPRERLMALSELRNLGNIPRADPKALRDPELVRNAVDLAASATDPMDRARIWHEMRGVRSEGLVQPLISALRQDSDGEVRLQALATLMKDFSTDPRVRTAFEAAASTDSRPLVRALAQRALGGEEAWKAYVVGSLKDTRRSPAERLDALLFHMGLQRSKTGGSYSPERVETLMDLMSDDVAKAIVEVLPSAVGESSAVNAFAYTFVNQLAQIGHPAITEMLLKSLDEGDGWMDRSFLVNQVAKRVSEPRVRSTLAAVAATDPDPRVRESVAAALGNAANDQAR